MMALRANLRNYWRRLSRLDLAALLLFGAGLISGLLGRTGGVWSFLKFLGILGAIYLLFRLVGWWRTRLLWSLRNRLIIAYLFIAVVPILLILTLVILAGQIVYSQLGGYLLYEDLHRPIEMMADISQHIAAAHGALPPSISRKKTERILAAQSHAVHDRELPRLAITFSDDTGLLRKVAGPAQGIIYTSGRAQYETTRGILAQGPSLPPAMLWMDAAVTGLSRLDSVYVDSDGKVDPQRPVLVTFNARPSRLNARIFASLGELSDLYLIGFIVLSVIFLLIEIAALITGVVMTRRITKAINDLYQATQYVQAGDLTHRVRIERRDQLGVLGESFNLMTGSINSLIEEQSKRQRLENEISIAREVQNQLFPQRLPVVSGVEVEAICKAARTVSGDYYDFIQLSPTHLAIAIADISGKGISAALLMASLQAALRSQLLTPDSDSLSTAELVSRLNKHMVRNTGDDRFATFFIAVYDSATRRLRYTNAGHLPGLLIIEGKARHLSEGGMVLGVVEDYDYEEGSLVVPRDGLLVTYSDGLVEPENVYGEEFGTRRLEEAAIRVQNAAPMMVGEALMLAAEEWAGTPEQADDMTVVVARLR